jgi:NADPH:quinone reductase-like Zn-dependent oxidoreductase
MIDTTPDGATLALQGLAAIGDGRGGFAIEPVSVRAPLAGEVRVRLTAAGICHTDHASRALASSRVWGRAWPRSIRSCGPASRCC